MFRMGHIFFLTWVFQSGGKAALEIIYFFTPLTLFNFFLYEHFDDYHYFLGHAEETLLCFQRRVECLYYDKIWMTKVFLSITVAE